MSEECWLADRSAAAAAEDAATAVVGFFFLSELLRAVDASSIFFCSAQNWSAAGVDAAGCSKFGTYEFLFAAFAAIA